MSDMYDNRLESLLNKFNEIKDVEEYNKFMAALVYVLTRMANLESS